MFHHNNFNFLVKWVGTSVGQLLLFDPVINLGTNPGTKLPTYQVWDLGIPG
jgi:hypothetical protein